MENIILFLKYDIAFREWLLIIFLWYVFKKKTEVNKLILAIIIFASVIWISLMWIPSRALPGGTVLSLYLSDGWMLFNLSTITIIVIYLFLNKRNKRLVSNKMLIILILLCCLFSFGIPYFLYLLKYEMENIIEHLPRIKL